MSEKPAAQDPGPLATIRVEADVAISEWLADGKTDRKTILRSRPGLRLSQAERAALDADFPYVLSGRISIETKSAAVGEFREIQTTWTAVRVAVFHKPS